VAARDARVVIVGVHGAGDRADWACSEWQAVTAGWAFVVCPEGDRHPSGDGTRVWSSAASIASRAERAVAALREAYGPWVAEGPLVYGGRSQSGSLAADVVASRPGLFDRVALVEVGPTPLDADRVAARFLEGRVKRVVVACESGPCGSFAARFEAASARRSLDLRTVAVSPRAHVGGDVVVRTLAPSFVWMVDDEARFAGLGAAVESRYLTD